MAGTRRRVAITGIGMVTPAGNDVATTWDALLAGRSAAGPIRSFDASGFSTRIAAEVKGFDAERVLGERKLLKSANRAHRFALAAAEQALRDAGVRPTPETAERTRVAIAEVCIRCRHESEHVRGKPTSCNGRDGENDS